MPLQKSKKLREPSPDFEILVGALIINAFLVALTLKLVVLSAMRVRSHWLLEQRIEDNDLVAHSDFKGKLF